MYYILAILWFAIGGGGFIYFWTKDQDLTIAELMLFIGSGILGPIGFIISWVCSSNTVIIKKRNKRGQYDKSTNKE